jgi:hypothetical protein
LEQSGLLTALLARIPVRLARVLLFGDEHIITQEIQAANPDICFVEGEWSDLGLELMSMPQSDNIAFIGSQEGAAILNQLLPASMKLSWMNVQVGLQRILAFLGIPQSALNQLDASGLEQALTQLSFA